MIRCADRAARAEKGEIDRSDVVRLDLVVLLLLLDHTPLLLAGLLLLVHGLLLVRRRPDGAVVHLAGRGVLPLVREEGLLLRRRRLRLRLLLRRGAAALELGHPLGQAASAGGASAFGSSFG